MPEQARLRYLDGGGEVGRLLRDRDWGQTPLGRPSGWPEALKTLVGLMMASAQPMFVAWGPERLMLYNDGYAALLHDRHPDALGRPFAAVWSDIMPTVGPILERAFAGVPTEMADIGFQIRRDGRLQEVHFSFSYTPVRGSDGAVDGMFCACRETTDEVRVQRAALVLAESEARFRNMADYAPVMMWVTDSSGRCTYLNRAWYEFTGQTEAEALGFGWLDATHPEDRAEAERQFRLANDRAEPVRLEYRLRRVDGVYRWAIDAAAPRFGAKGEGFLGFIGSVIDIDERREAERELARREAQARAQADELNALYAAAPVGLCVLDRDMRFVRVNDRLAEINGRSAAEHIGRHVGEIVPGLTAQVLEAMQRVLGGESLDGFEIVGETPAQPGVERVWRENWLPLRNGAGAVTGVIVSAEDVTEERRAQKALERINDELERRVAESLAERRLLAEMVERTPIFVQVVGLDWRWLAINEAAAREFERIFGVLPRKGDDMRVLLADQPEQLAAVTEVWSRALAGEEFIEIAEFGDADGDRRAYDMRYYTLRDGAGRRIGAYQFVTDVTERLAEQKQLVEMQKMESIGQLTGGVAHDFNNLLAAILSNLDLARKRVSDVQTARLVDGAIKGAERGAVLTKRLLAFARRQDLRSEAVSLPALFEGMRDLLERSLGPSVAIVASFATGLPEVEVDANQLELALLNVAVNARDAMPDGGQLTVSAAAEPLVAAPGREGVASGDYVRISITDTGRGMDAATLRRAAEPFFTTKGLGKGTGLGLSMVQGLAAQSGGLLRMRSAPDEGTTIELWLPQARREAGAGVRGATAEPQRSEAASRPLKVLVVDDDMLVGMGTAAMLEDLGHAVVEAPSGQAALELHAQHGDIDVVVTDHSMPGMTGTELAAALAARDPGLPVILATGYAELPEGGRSSLPRLSKPFRQEDLEAVLGRVLAAAHGETPAFRS